MRIESHDDNDIEMNAIACQKELHSYTQLPSNIVEERDNPHPSRGYSTIRKLPYYSRAMEEELYDEFGNYIGPEVKDSEEESVSVGRFRRIWRLIA